MLIKEWFWSDDSDRMCQDCHSSLIDMRRQQPAVPLYDIAASVTLFIGYANAATYNNVKKLQRHDVTQYYMLTDIKVSHTTRIMKRSDCTSTCTAEGNIPHDGYQPKLQTTFWVGSLFQ